MGRLCAEEGAKEVVRTETVATRVTGEREFTILPDAVALAQVICTACPGGGLNLSIRAADSQLSTALDARLRIYRIKSKSRPVVARVQGDGWLDWEVWKLMPASSP